MLDYNHRPSIAEKINDHIDAVLIAERDATPPRTYLGASRLGVSCERALQFEFTHAPKDEGGDFSGQVLRIFAIGHMLEDLAIRWLRGAGFDLYTHKAHRPDGEQFGFSVANGRIRGHVDGIIAAAPEELGIGVPALWECKTMNARNWRETVKKGVAVAKPVYAAQIAIYQAYMEPSVPGISEAPALFTAINKDTAELYHELVPFDAALAQRMSDRAVRILPVDKAVFYPEGVEGLFEIYYAPADTFETVNTLGLPLYARSIPDRDRDEWVRLEIESNPLPICTRPQVLRSARRT